MGNVYVTKNITFDDKGYLMLSSSPRTAMTTDVDSDFGNVAAIIHNTDYDYFMATWGEPFSADDSILRFVPSQVTTTNFPSTAPQSGLDYLGSLLLVTTATEAKYYNATSNTWTTTNISLTNSSSSQHDVCNIISLNAIAVADVNTISLYASPLS